MKTPANPTPDNPACVCEIHETCPTCAPAAPKSAMTPREDVPAPPSAQEYGVIEGQPPITPTIALEAATKELREELAASKQAFTKLFIECREAQAELTALRADKERSRAYSDVAAERARQDEKWGEQNHELTLWAAILAEELGEFSQAALHAKFGGDKSAGAREEAVQCAAVSVAIVEMIDRQDAAHIARQNGGAS
jgi:hypothetical protein